MYLFGKNDVLAFRKNDVLASGEKTHAYLPLPEKKDVLASDVKMYL